MEMDVEPEPVPEALCPCGGSSCPPRDGGRAGLLGGPPPQLGDDGAGEEAPDFAAQAAVEGETIAQTHGEAEDPLPGGDARDDVVCQVCGRHRHATCTTGGTKAPSLAAERHQSVEFAVVTVYPEKAMLETAAAQVPVELALHEEGPAAAALASCPPQPRPRVRHGAVEKSAGAVAGNMSRRGRRGRRVRRVRRPKPRLRE